MLCLVLAGCGSPAPDEQTVRFLVITNGILDKAMLDGRLSAVTFEAQTPVELTVTGVEAADSRITEAPRPGAWSTYVFAVTIGKTNRFADATIHVEKPLPVKGAFRISAIKEIAPIAISGSQNWKGGVTQLNHATFRLCTATLEPTFTGKVENIAPGDPNDPFEKAAEKK
jgi:hypothetical protein